MGLLGDDQVDAGDGTGRASEPINAEQRSEAADGVARKGDG